jgi:hypothetical protein
MVLDALRHAGGVARRAQEATSGSKDTLLFNAVAEAIAEFTDRHPSMLALAHSALRRMD